MLEELTGKSRVVGIKQSRRAISQGQAAKVFLACDADPELLESLAKSCDENGVPVEKTCTMAQLGDACRISVGAAVAVLLK
ncbi:ribosomal L7Ae/L30e/S12e/Gadd45 family protein [Oscillibacter valericigenes]|nr:ribosomal L7Ae/L30e/S12e/Gadd45 family protein [Oscillibacter valericigenes]